LSPQQVPSGQASVGQALAAAKAALAADAAAAPSLAVLAEAAGVSPRSLQRHFAAVLGRSPQAVLQQLRLAAARQTLRSGEVSVVLDAALQHGFEHPGRFAIAYARAFGEAPSATLRAARTRAPAAVGPSGTPILLQPLRPATLAEAACARRASDDLAIALGRMRDLVLLSPDAPLAEAGRAFRLEGRVEGKTATLSLLHTARGRVIATLREELAMQAGVAWANRAARAVAASVRAERVEEARRTPRHRMDAETLVLRARPAMLSQDPGLTRTALDLLEEALHRDPWHARAHALTGFGQAVAANHCFGGDPATGRERALDHMARALALAGDDPEVLTLAAGVMSFTGRLEEAEQLAAQSLALDPDQPEALRRLGILRIFRGDAQGAAAIFRRLLRGWPAGNDGNMALIQIGIADFALGRYSRSARVLSHALDQQPFRTWPHRFLTAAAWHAGAHEEARRSLAALQRAFPDLTVDQCDRADALHPNAKARVLDGLACAGLPR
jgi:AraC-like DNA-binding protein